ncbi:hypothetical protein O6H91_01G102500 [Diphasiastrum complanatum]|uniref:Uncharacterized protein n=2 Tax=Diphasiastrum complanatum TaxID=34168 RepID=A0ACC2EU41_DIPCM|nr:hypothetical protein O6H91_01G102500 [Diphasiastrum complanatum]KAJ7569987.1 hypothetical protein O6H91_01G102500 [Diphasiastrum complanatum]
MGVMLTQKLRSRICCNVLSDVKQRFLRTLPCSLLASSVSDWKLVSSCKQPFQWIERTVSYESHASVAGSLKEGQVQLLRYPSNGIYLTRREDCLNKNCSYSFNAFERTPSFLKKVKSCESLYSYFAARLFSSSYDSVMESIDQKSGSYYSKDESEFHRDVLSSKKEIFGQKDSGAIYQEYRWQSDSVFRHLRRAGVSACRFRTSRVGYRFSTSANSALNQHARVDADSDAEAESECSGPGGERPHELPMAEDWEQQNMLPDERYYHEENNSSTEHNSVEESDVYIPVEAFFIARSVDLKSLSEEPFVDVISGRKHLVIRCRDHSDESSCLPGEVNGAATDSWSLKRYMVVFQWGSVVLFNFGPHKEEDSLNIVKKHCKDIFKEEIKENYGVLVRPTLDRYSQGGHDKIMVKTLDTDGLRIISLILSQSIALDHYTKAIDGMLTSFGELNRTMEMTGTFKLHRKELFQLVAAANTTLADAILRIGLLERSDVAWQNANYDRIWGYLRDDFELDERFESLEFKTGIIQHNVKFFLDILQNRKSDLLEWIIIFLIAGEIMVSLYDILHGTGAL